MSTHPSDAIAQQTFLGPDDKAFKDERKRKAKPRVALPSIPDGPCCARCANWRPDADPEDFGLCLRLVTVEERVPAGPAKGTVFSIDQAMQQAEWTFDYLRTRGFAQPCSQFAAKDAA